MRTDDATETSEPRSRLAALTRFVSDRVWHARPTKIHARWQAITLIALCLAVYVPGLFTIPPIDRDESRFAQASRQMFESIALPESQKDPAMHSGGLAVPYVIDKPRLNKPPLIYWIQTASAATFTLGNPLSDAIWMYRLPSAIFATLTILMTWRIGHLLFDARAAWLGAALLAICPLVVIDAHQGRADQLMVACTTAAMWALAGIVKQSRIGDVPFRLAIGLAIAIAAGVLAKGPITPMIVALAIIAYAIITKRFRWILSTHPWLAAIVTAITIGPWIYFVAQHVGFSEYKALVFDETVGRSAAPKEGHWGPPGYHMLLLPVLFWPGSLGVALAFVHLFNRRKGWRPARWQEAFLVAWILPAWIGFELVSTKLPHYTMPMYPAVALLCARALCRADVPQLLATGRLGKLLRGLILLWLTIPWMLALALLWPARLSLMFWLGTRDTLANIPPEVMLEVPNDGLPWLSTLIASAILILIAGTLMSRKVTQSPEHWTILRRTSAAWVLAFIVVGTFAMPKLNNLSTRVVQAIKSTGWMGDPVILGNYQEDSLVFLLRGRAERIGSDDPALARLREGDQQFIVLEQNPEPTPVSRPPATWIRGTGVSTGPHSLYVLEPAP